MEVDVDTTTGIWDPLMDPPQPKRPMVHAPYLDSGPVVEQATELLDKEGKSVLPRAKSNVIPDFDNLAYMGEGDDAPPVMAPHLAYAEKVRRALADKYGIALEAPSTSKTTAELPGTRAAVRKAAAAAPPEPIVCICGDPLNKFHFGQKRLPSAQGDKVDKFSQIGELARELWTSEFRSAPWRREFGSLMHQVLERAVDLMEHMALEELPKEHMGQMYV